ncbi:helix-turn-helix domain-containing protein [Thalassotalea euphylliae]|uniref:helix-turn-helix domain-containing protein n=1 Tax=Thalassotalea euphylliae TaxID=1655234 RepID=UPI00362E3562
MNRTKNHKNTKIISQVAQYIYDNSDKAISLDALASHTGFSKYHFNRLFFAATGYQLGEFIQRHKLEKALNHIKTGNHNIIDVALSIGYDSPSSFTRAFKKHFSLTPTDVMQGKQPSNERAGNLPPKKLFAETPVIPVLETLPKQTILGLYGKGFSEQSFSALAGQLYGRLATIAEKMSFDALQPIGVAVDNPWVGAQSESNFFAGFINGLDQHFHTLQTFEWQAGKWACFTHLGSHDSMWQTISQVYSQWVLPNDIALKDQQIVQRYVNSPLDTPPERLETKLYFAIDESHTEAT